MRRLIASENQEQRALVRWIRMQPLIANCLVKLNNEGKRTEAQGWHLKLMGMMPGASDLFLAWPTIKFCGLWMEVKQNRTYPTSEREKESWKAQESFIGHMKEVGYDGYFVFGWEHGKEIVEAYLKT
jgi:hypothetical protein